MNQHNGLKILELRIKYKFEKLGKDIKSREELEEMSKHDLIDFGRLQYKLLLDKSQKRSI